MTSQIVIKSIYLMKPDEIFNISLEDAEEKELQIIMNYLDTTKIYKEVIVHDSLMGYQSKWVDTGINKYKYHIKEMVLTIERNS